MKFIRPLLKLLLCAFFVVAGASHFIRTDLYLEIMPTYVPQPLLAVYLSGAFEILLGLLILVPRLQRGVAWGMILLLIAVFPANIQMALHPDLYPEIPRWGLYARLPLQGVFILWAYLFTKSKKGLR